MQSQSVIKFSLLVLFLLIILFSTHFLILTLCTEVFDELKIIVSYVLSLVLTCISFIILIRSLANYVSNAGYIFMWISFVKFGFYLITFKYLYVLDSDPKAIDLSMVLVPYLSTLFFEVYYLVQILKAEDIKE